MGLAVYPAETDDRLLCCPGAQSLPPAPDSPQWGPWITSLAGSLFSNQLIFSHDFCHLFPSSQMCHGLGGSEALKIELSCVGDSAPLLPHPHIQAGQGCQGQWFLEGFHIPFCRRLQEERLRCDDPTSQPRSAQSQSLEQEVKSGESGVLALTPPSSPHSPQGQIGTRLIFPVNILVWEVTGHIRGPTQMASQKSPCPRPHSPSLPRGPSSDLSGTGLCLSPRLPLIPTPCLPGRALTHSHVIAQLVFGD